MNPKKIVFFIYQNPQLYPPTINAANIFCEVGFDVTLIGFDTKIPGNIDINPRIRNYNLGRINIGFLGVVQYLISIFRVLFIIRRENPNWILSYDAYASIISYISAKTLKIKWVYYQHDFWEGPKGYWQRIIYFLEKKVVQDSEFWCFPQTERAKLFSELVMKKKEILIIHNGPRKNWFIKSSESHEIVQELKRNFQFIVLYQGGWSAEFGLSKLIDSVSLIDKRVCFLFLGKEHEKGIKKTLKNYTVLKKVENRVFFHNAYINYDSLPTITKFCDIGLTILVSDNDNVPTNIRHLAGASNKIIEYISFGLPVITSDCFSNRAFFKKYPIALICNSDDPADIAKNINSIFNDPIGLAEIKNRNEKIFLDELSFEKQLEKLTLKIMKHE